MLTGREFCVTRIEKTNTSASLPQKCQHCTMRHAGLCATLTAPEMVQFNAMSHTKHFSAGQLIRLEGEPVSFYANVISGAAKTIKSTHDGRQQIVGLILPGDFIDRVFVEHAPCSVEAMSDMELCAYPRGRFEAIVKKDPDLEHRLLTLALDDLDQAEEWMLLLGRKTAREKVASFLLLLARRSHHFSCPHLVSERQAFAGPLTIHIPMTRNNMADYLGLTTETVCRQMTSLRKDGVIDLPDNHCFTCPDIERLEQEADR